MSLSLKIGLLILYLDILCCSFRYVSHNLWTSRVLTSIPLHRTFSSHAYTVYCCITASRIFLFSFIVRGRERERERTDELSWDSPRSPPLSYCMQKWKIQIHMKDYTILTSIPMYFKQIIQHIWRHFGVYQHTKRKKYSPSIFTAGWECKAFCFCMAANTWHALYDKVQ